MPLRGLLLESSDARFGPMVVGGHQVVVDGGFVLPITNETGGPIELKQTTCLSVSNIGGDDGDMWFETKTAECDDAPIATGIRFATANDGDGDVHFDATTSCDPRAAGEAPIGPSENPQRGISPARIHSEFLSGVEFPAFFSN